MPSKNNDFPLWVVRAGSLGEANDLFLNQSFVAIGWPELNDLSSLPNDREAFKKKYDELYPGSTVMSTANCAGQIYRFVHQIKNDDYILYPSKIDRLIHVGKVTSSYKFNSKQNEDFPHQRKVEWLKTILRTNLSQGALYEIGSALTVFQIKNYSEEFLTLIKGSKSVVITTEDDSVEKVTNFIEESTTDFIIKRLAQTLKGKAFEYFVAHLLQKMGYKTRVSPAGTDGGVDIIAHKDELGFEPPIIKVQVKSGENSSIGNPVVSSLYGHVSSNEFGLFITLGTFTNQAKEFAKGKGNLRIIDGAELSELVLNHYESFDTYYKGIIPLKRVYVPEAVNQ